VAVLEVAAMEREQVINRDPETMGGTPVFAGTRVPVQTLIDYLSGGENLDDFLDGFPSVSREQAEAFLKLAQDEAFTEAIREGQQAEQVEHDEVFAKSLGAVRGMWKERDELPDFGTLRQEFDDRGAFDSEADSASSRGRKWRE
jgi:uncharacterized protein (DUF433 family)